MCVWMVAVISAAGTQAAIAAPMGTGFTYQGSLKKNGVAVNATADVAFTLWDAVSAGAQIGGSHIVMNVAVANGLFTVQVNTGNEFGASAFNGEARWLQVAVRSPAGLGVYANLAPRQAVSATPYALHVRGIVVDSAGNAGLGTAAPIARLHVSAAGASSGDNSAIFQAPAIGVNASHIHYGTTGDWYIRSADGFGKVVIQDTGGDVRLGSSMFVIPGGNVGFGTGFPGARVDAVSSAQPAVRGTATSGVGVSGNSTNFIGVFGANTAGSAGVIGQSAFIGVQGNTTGNDPNRQAIRGDNSFSASGWAGVFTGNVGVFGTLSKSAGSFKIDHPLDPANKTLAHSFVESPDMMNVYNGNVVTDERGYAEVRLPDYFEALNRDFRYQLTVLDAADSDDFVQAKVVRKVRDNRFSIRTSAPGVEVSWQVTGIRQDAYAVANPIHVEEDKPAEQRGRYLSPAVFGAPKELGIHHLSAVPPGAQP